MASTDYRALDTAGIDLYAVDTVQKYPIGLVVDLVSATHGFGKAIYLGGAANIAEGSAVTYDEAGAVTLLAANAKGPVAFALAATVANTYGFYGVHGKFLAKSAAASADNGSIGREGADGTIGDGRAAGDEIIGAIARSATDTPLTGFCWVQLTAFPFVNDATGA